ncbi:Tfp pilus assembly protein FimV [Bordetella parapertussis]|nr:FimV/HubP family polar landmark protein [Bordetella parapertussis]AOB39102.1 peptidoglycan-binding protein LysM [Bordetella parapertussis]QJP59416.1 peptidoglycan-binding protein LysM [Bordetella parapertussis]QJP66830.1 peptidoglycan-binding protein LysM [Bordetella parapertussis]UEB06450.1 peptidoglycan-binding protein LysM [Bordetella parapertussis]UEB17220.1 peptidoglycan-binding protein LysM [Bordetella parapertussis]
MRSTLRPLQPARRSQALSWALVLALGAGATGAEAARLGHARVVSPPGAALQVVVPLLELSADDLATLQVSLADEAAWRQAGLTPPVPLSSATVRIEPGADASRRNVRISSSQPPAGNAVDVLLDLRSGAGQRQVQVTTILVPPRGSAARVAPASVGTPAPAGQASAGSIDVRRGDTLFGIAQRNAVAGASVYQMLVALWRANSEAFIQNNMNLVRAGETLDIPDAATVRAIDPAEARRIFAQHAEAFARYRGRAGALAAGGAAVSGTGEAGAGRLGSAAQAEAAGAATAQDRLRLSSAQGGANAQADAAGDARASSGRALDDAQQRVEKLQSNVDALSQAAGAGKTASGEGSAPANASAGAGGQPGADGKAGADGKPGADGRPGSDGKPGADGKPGGAAAGAGAATQAGAASAGSTGANGAAAGSAGAGAAGSGPAAAPGAAGSASGNASGLSLPGGAAGQGGEAAKGESTQGGMPGWLADNLLAIVTAVLALIVFIVAWALRRAGARRDDDEASAAYPEPTLDTAALTRKLDSISLDLDEPPTDEPRPGGKRT